MKSHYPPLPLPLHRIPVDAYGMQLLKFPDRPTAPAVGSPEQVSAVTDNVSNTESATQVKTNHDGLKTFFENQLRVITEELSGLEPTETAKKLIDRLFEISSTFNDAIVSLARLENKKKLSNPDDDSEHGWTDLDDQSVQFCVNTTEACYKEFITVLKDLDPEKRKSEETSKQPRPSTLFSSAPLAKVCTPGEFGIETVEIQDKTPLRKRRDSESEIVSASSSEDSTQTENTTSGDENVETVKTHNNQLLRKKRESKSEIVSVSSSEDSTQTENTTSGDENHVVVNIPANKDVRSQKTKGLQERFDSEWEDYKSSILASPGAIARWNFLAGMVAYASSFGVANLCRLVPYGSIAVPIVASVLHTTVSGPLSGMVRASTSDNPRVRQQLYTQRIVGRAWGDKHRAAAGMKLSARFEWKNQDGTIEKLTAGQILEKSQGWGDWQQKVITEDLPFTSFTLAYFARNLVISATELLTSPGNFEIARSNQPPIPLKEHTFSTNLIGGGFLDTFVQLLVGSAAGGMTMFFNQELRKKMSAQIGSIETVTKPIYIWKLEANYLRSYKDDLEKEIASPDRPNPQYESELQAELAKVKINLAKAEAKSGFFTSFSHEASLMWQTSRRGVSGDPEQPGKRTETLCDIGGKFLSLTAVAATGYFVGDFAAGRAHSFQDLMFKQSAKNFAAPFFLIFYPGWMGRSEFAGLIRQTIGLAKGRSEADAYKKANHVTENPARDHQDEAYTEVETELSDDRNQNIDGTADEKLTNVPEDRSIIVGDDDDNGAGVLPRAEKKLKKSIEDKKSSARRQDYDGKRTTLSGKGEDRDSGKKPANESSPEETSIIVGADDASDAVAIQNDANYYENMTDHNEIDSDDDTKYQAQIDPADLV